MLRILFVLSLMSLLACSSPAPEAAKKSKLNEGCVVSADCEGVLGCYNGKCLTSAPIGFGDATIGSETTNSDAGATDAVKADTTPDDAKALDSSAADAAADAVAVDQGPADAGPVDSGPLDVAAADSGPVDSGKVDANPVDTGPADTGPDCASVCAGKTCGEAGGALGMCNCGVCADGEQCNDSFACEKINKCLTVKCAACNSCDPKTGACNPDATQNGNNCGNGGTCDNGTCAPQNKCLVVKCAACNKCDPTTGNCNPDAAQNGNLCSVNGKCNNGSCATPCGTITWAAKAPLTSKDHIDVSVVYNGELHAIGGSFYLSHRKYNPGNDKWTDLAKLKLSATEGAAAVIGGKLYAVGDATFDAKFAMVWDAAADSWANLAANPFPRRLPGNGVIDNKLYLAGGFAGNDEHVNVYDPNANSWKDLAPLAPAGGGGASTVYDGKLYFFGWSNAGGMAKAYDPKTDKWNDLQGLPDNGGYLGKAVVIGDKIWVLGGRAQNTVKDSVQIYDPVANSWCTSTSKLPVPNMGFACGVIDGKIYISGGQNMDGAVFDATWAGTIQ